MKKYDDATEMKTKPKQTQTLPAVLVAGNPILVRRSVWRIYPPQADFGLLNRWGKPHLTINLDVRMMNNKIRGGLN